MENPTPKFYKYSLSEINQIKKRVISGEFQLINYIANGYMYDGDAFSSNMWGRFNLEIKNSPEEKKKILVKLLASRNSENEFRFLIKNYLEESDLLGLDSFRLGFCYYYGWGTSIDLEKSFFYFSKSFNKDQKINFMPAFYLVKIHQKQKKEVNKIHLDSLNKIKSFFSNDINKVINDLDNIPVSKLTLTFD